MSLLTGASGGIGEAVVRQLAARKQNLVLVARNAGKLSEISKLLRAQYGIQYFSSYKKSLRFPLTILARKFGLPT